MSRTDRTTRRRRARDEEKHGPPRPPEERLRDFVTEAHKIAQELEPGRDREDVLYMLRRIGATLMGYGKVVRRQEHLSIVKDGE